jgi:HK97 family phage prohead protease
MMDGDMEPPELRGGADYERRSVDLAELRVEGEGEGNAPHIRGHAAVFSSPTEIYGLFGSFIEEIAPGAFTKTLKEADVRALLNHNPDYVLGRNRAGTLGLTEDSRGLAVDIMPPDTQWARDLMVSMARGDITQMSFGFIPVAGKSSWTYGDGNGLDKVVRREVMLLDVSVATFGAYQQTDAYVRSAIAALQCYLTPPEPAPRGHSESTRREPPTPRHSLPPTGSRQEALPESGPVRQMEPTRQPSHSLRVDWSRLERLESLIAKEKTK